MRIKPHRTTLPLGIAFVALFTFTSVNTTDVTAQASMPLRPHVASDTKLGDWDWPVAPPRFVARPFEAPATRYSAGHRGIDIELSSGGAVFAAEDGIVYFAGNVAGRPVLSIEHDGGLLSSYEPVTSTLTAGDVVRKGETVGVVAAGGHCDGGCLHFGVRLYGEYVSPMLLLGGIPRAVLLPLG